MASDLTHRERVALALDHQATDRVPIAMVCSGINAPAHVQLEAYLEAHRQTTVAAYLEPLIDIAGVGPDYTGSDLKPGWDMWGVRRDPVSYGSGHYNEISHYPLAGATTVDDIAAHAWPSVEWFDYSVMPERIVAARAERDYCLMASNGNVFECSWYMRGFEQMLLDVAISPELAHEILQRVTDFWVEHFTRLLAASKGEIDLVFTADDVGGQEGLLMSLGMWEEFIKPHHERLNRTIHEFGAKVIYHSDGAVMDAVPGLIDMGIDVLQALQFDAKGMDAEMLKTEYGDRLCFEGGVSVQSTLPFGTPEEVENEVRERIDVLGRDGGYILGHPTPSRPERHPRTSSRCSTPPRPTRRDRSPAECSDPSWTRSSGSSTRGFASATSPITGPVDARCRALA